MPWKIYRSKKIEPGVQVVSKPEPAAPSKIATPAEIEFIQIPAGEFLFGSNNETRGIEEPYWISKYPVTNAQFKHFLDSKPKGAILTLTRNKDRTYPPEKANHPAANISWSEATEFCQWAKCHLPTEEEWEKAARGTDGRLFPWGDDWEDGKFANSKEAGIEDTTPMDQYPLGISPYGVWDMSGNVWEWTASGPSSTIKMMCGGSFSNSKKGLRCAFRLKSIFNDSKYNWGFRVVLYDPR